MSVEVWEDYLNIPTYEVGEENESPDLLGEGYSRVYPYSRNLFLKGVKKNYRYKAIFIENEYLKLIILPERGGRLYSAYDKISKKEIFYKNRVIKPALIQLYGAWIAAGVEFNFPKGHSITSFKTVDYTYRKNPDGSATAIVGNIDLVSRMRWSVFITLYPKTSYIELTVKLHNRSNLPERYYFWTNCAVEATNGLRIILPVNKVISDVWTMKKENFPISKGIDISLYKNWYWAIDLFAYNCEEDFFGYYNEDNDFGLVHYANHFENFGKKYFTWGVSPDGLRWARFLTDDMNPYVEFQCGPFLTQADYEFLNPYGSNIWKEYFIPVRGTGGFIFANKDVVLNLKVNRNIINFYINVTKNFNNCLILAKINEKVIYKKKSISLYPEKTCLDSISLKNPQKDDKLSIYVVNKDKVLLIYESLIGEVGSFKSREIDNRKFNKEEKLYQEALNLEKSGLTMEAKEKYKTLLIKNSRNSKVLLRLGIINLSQGLFNEARQLLNKVVKFDLYNHEVYYFLGLVYKLEGKFQEAKENFWKLSNTQYACGGYCELGKVALIERRYEDAVDLFEKAFFNNSSNPKIIGLYVASLRRLGRVNEAKDVIENFVKKEPIDGLILNELGLLCKENNLKKEYKEIICKMPENSIEISMDYISSGLYEEAISLLLLSKKTFSNYPLIYYYLGYCYEKLGDLKKAKRYYYIGSKIKCKRVFPWQLESIEILKRAIEYFPNLPNTYEYLGNLMFYKYRYKECLKYFSYAKKLNSKSSIVFRNIGLVSLKLGVCNKKIINAYMRAIKYNPYDWELYYEFDKFLSERGYLDIRRKIILKIPNKVLEHPKLYERKAKVLIDDRRFDEVLSFIKNRNFYPWEGELVNRRIYEDAWNGKAELLLKSKNYEEALKCLNNALLYPENIGIGMVKDRIHARSLFLKGIIYKILKMENKQKENWDKILIKSKGEVKFSVVKSESLFYYPFERLFYSSLVFVEYNKIQKAKKILMKIYDMCKKDNWYSNRIVSYFHSWGFLNNLKKVSVNEELLCGYKLPKIHVKYLKRISNLVNSKRRFYA